MGSSGSLSHYQLSLANAILYAGILEKTKLPRPCFLSYAARFGELGILLEQEKEEKFVRSRARWDFEGILRPGVVLSFQKK